MVNRIVLIGRLTADPTLRSTSTGKSVCSFSIAVNRRVKSQDGTDADFFRATCWGQTAEYVNSYITKGRLVSVDGRLETKKWTDQSGNEREGVEIVADNVSGLDKPKDDAPAPKSSVPAPRQQTTGGADEYDPFADD